MLVEDKWGIEHVIDHSFDRAVAEAVAYVPLPDQEEVWTEFDFRKLEDSLMETEEDPSLKPWCFLI